MLFQERTTRYPFLRRFSRLFAGSLVPDVTAPSSRVVLWGFGYVVLWTVPGTFSFQLYALYQGVDLSWVLGPVLYFLAPQPISASLTTLILRRVPDDPLRGDAITLVTMTEGDLVALAPHRARDPFLLGSVASFLLVFGTPGPLWLVSIS